MHPIVYNAFERICSKRKIIGSVLEIGAIPSKMSLLCMKSLGQAKEKIGLNLEGPREFRDFKILQGNANSMECFEDQRFDVVLCNAVLEHDKYFWKTIGEINRVTKSGGLVVIGAPGYTHFHVDGIKSILGRIPVFRNLRLNRYLNAFFTATITIQMHNAPGDYYRFSPQAFKEVFFEGMTDVEVRSVMLPPRIIGAGVKK